MGQGNANFKSSDLAKFGFLILNKGQWKNSRALSQEAISKIGEANEIINWNWLEQDNNPDKDKSKYGYQWYKTTFHLNGKTFDSTRSWCNGGQFIFVVPALDAVVVFTGSNQGNKADFISLVEF